MSLVRNVTHAETKKSPSSAEQAVSPSLEEGWDRYVEKTNAISENQGKSTLPQLHFLLTHERNFINFSLHAIWEWRGDGET